MENTGHVSEREVEERQKEGLFSEPATARAKNDLLANLSLWQALMMVGFYIPELPGASAPRQSWRVWRSTSRYSVQLVLAARKATERLHRHRQRWRPLASAFTCLLCPTACRGSPWKKKLIWELASVEMTGPGTPNFPPISSGKWKHRG